MPTYAKTIVTSELQLFFVPYFSSTKLKISFVRNNKRFRSVSAEKFKSVHGVLNIFMVLRQELKLPGNHLR